MPRRTEPSEVTSQEKRSSLGLFLLCAEKREHIKPKVLFVLETGLSPARTKPREPQQKAKKSYISDGRVLKLILGSNGRGRSLQTQSPPRQTASNLAVSGSGYPPALSVRLVRMGQRNPAPETPRTQSEQREEAAPEGSGKGGTQDHGTQEVRTFSDVEVILASSHRSVVTANSSADAVCSKEGYHLSLQDIE